MEINHKKPFIHSQHLALFWIESFDIIDMNEACLKTLDITSENLLGQRVLDVFPETEEREGLLLTAFDNALSGETAFLQEIEYAIPDEDANDGKRNIWWNVHFTPVTNSQGDVSYILLRVNDISSLVKNREMKDAIAGEMQHRVGNLLAMVLTLARMTARGQTSLKAFLPEFEARIQTLTKTHSLLTNDNWDGLTMNRLIHQQLDAYADKLGNSIFVEGPDLRVNAAEA